MLFVGERQDSVAWEIFVRRSDVVVTWKSLEADLGRFPPAFRFRLVQVEAWDVACFYR